MFSAQALALAPWSVTKAKLTKTCPLAWKYKYRDRLPEHPTLVTRVGVGAHGVLERLERGEPMDRAIEGASEEHHLSAEERAGMQRFIAGMRAFMETLARFRAHSAITRELCEAKLGLTAGLEPTEFFARDAFFRGALDLCFVLSDNRVAIVDHKTGKKSDLKWHAAQLRSYAVMALAHFPRLRKVWPAIHFVGDAEVVWGRPTLAEEIRDGVRAWFIAWINEAAERANEPDPRPVVSRFCDFCSYRPICPAHTMEAAGERLVALSTRRSSSRRLL